MESWFTHNENNRMSKKQVFMFSIIMLLLSTFLYITPAGMIITPLDETLHYIAASIPMFCMIIGIRSYLNEK
jgi:Ca2+/H+ antiporter